MATYYWVGGTGTWSSASNTNWSLTSGGAGGAGIPTSADDVIFNSASGSTFTVTPSGGNCRSWTVTTPTAMTLTGAGGINVYGNITLSATGLTASAHTGPITLLAASTGWTITTNNISLGSRFAFNNASGGWTLGSALTTTGAFAITAGSFSTGNFSITTNNISSSGTGVRTLTLGTSTWTTTAGIDFSTSTNLTFNAGTSTITMAGGVFYGTGQTFYNFSVTSTSGNISIYGANTFNNMTFAARASATMTDIKLFGSQTVNGTFTTSGANNSGRIKFFSNAFNTPRTLSAATTSIAQTDFRDITATGGGSWSGTSIGNMGGNSGITFTAAKTVYVSSTGSAYNYGGAVYATSSGGAGNRANFPLAQDTLIYDDSSGLTGAVVTLSDAYALCSISFAARTLPLTFTLSGIPFETYGSLTVASTITMTSVTTIYFFGRGSYTLTSAGNTFSISLTMPGGTLTLQDALNGSMGWSDGTLDLNGYTFTMTATSIVTGTAKVLVFNGGTIVVTNATTTAWYNISSDLTTSAGTANGVISMTAATAKTFEGGSVVYAATLRQGGAGILSVTGSNGFADMSAVTSGGAIRLTAGTTTTLQNFTLSGASGNLQTLNSLTSGTQATLSKPSGVAAGNYLSLRDMNATGGASWYAQNSTNVSNNTGWTFGAPPTVGTFLMMF